jgi:hypothetical protein
MTLIAERPADVTTAGYASPSGVCRQSTMPSGGGGIWNGSGFFGVGGTGQSSEGATTSPVSPTPAGGVTVKVRRQ